MDDLTEFLSVLRGSAAIAVPAPATPTPTDEEGFYSAKSRRWVEEMRDSVVKSRAYRKGVK